VLGTCTSATITTALFGTGVLPRLELAADEAVGAAGEVFGPAAADPVAWTDVGGGPAERNRAVRSAAGLTARRVAGRRNGSTGRGHGRAAATEALGSAGEVDAAAAAAQPITGLGVRLVLRTRRLEV
jgi:hypothetical protein